MAIADAIDWLLISLKRTPERLEIFQMINANVDLKYEVLEAIDGKRLDLDELIRAGFADADIPWGPGAIGAAISHRLCWERAIETGRPVGILEDDVFLRNDFMERMPEVFELLPKDWDVVHLGFNTDSIIDLNVNDGLDLFGGFSASYPTEEACARFVASTGSVGPVRSNNTFGNCCYVVSPRGAEKLIKGCFPLGERRVWVPALNSVIMAQSKDIVMNMLYRHMKNYVCLPPIALPINDKPSSTIGVL